jgi:hypothetical protein
MGQGAYLTIYNNDQNYQAGVTFGSFSCMNDNPQDTTVQPGGQSARQYLEAKASGGCAFDTSSFAMTVNINNANCQFNFTESDWAWYVDNGTAAQEKVANDTVSVKVTQNGEGNQDLIAVTINPSSSLRKT